MSQPVQQVVQGQVVQGQIVQGQIVQGQVVSGTQIVNNAGQVVMTTNSGITSMGNQQLVTQLVQSSVGHNPGTTVVTSTLPTQLAQGQISNVHMVQSSRKVVAGQQIQTVNHQMIQGQQIQQVNHHGTPVSAVGGSVPTATAIKREPMQNQTVPAPQASTNQTADTTTPVLNKQRISELVREVDPNEQLDEDVEEMLLAIADDFIESTVNAACRLAKHRGARSLDVKDVQMYLERNWHMWIPGFGTEELRPYKRAPTTEAHKQRLALIRKAIKKY
ncbi:unnamed protein product, partial [Meganyctiphanes norvegica]